MRNKKLNVIFYLSLCCLVIIEVGCASRNYDNIVFEKNKPLIVANSSSVGNQVCVECHETVKGRKISVSHNDCEGCHGGGNIHVDGDKKGSIAFPDDQKCISCHKTNNGLHMTWNTSQHKRAGVMCFNCHEAHGKEESKLGDKQDIRFRKISKITALCISCHKEMLGKINLPSHHPLKEGGISCVDCHNPHGDSMSKMSNINGTCYKCHQDKRGPWVFEHPPVTEDCTICHNPHGSPNTELLKIAQPTLCLNCHAFPHSSMTPERRRCTNCHPVIHGSHQNKRFTK